MTELDALDTLAAEVFDGYLVKKDLAQQFRGQYPVPTYVGEFMLGRYCATTDPDAIAAGLEMVQQSMQDRTVRAGEEELFKHRARDQTRVKVVDLLRARLDSRNDAYKAELPSLQLNDIHIAPDLVDEHQRMLTGGFYAEVTLEYIAALAGEQGGQPFRVDAIRPIQMSTRDALGTFVAGRNSFTLNQWRELLLRSVGFEPSRLNARQQDVLIARMVPFVVRNYNAVELGPRGTGKSHLFQQVSPYAHLVSGGKATVANMFVNMNTGRRGLVAQYDVICFDEVSGVSFDQKEGVNILKGYMESGEFSRGRESIRAEGGIVMVGNFDVDVETQLRIGHLLLPLPREMRDDTAFMDRIHAYLPGWDVPKLDPTYFTDHFGFVSDYLAEVWSQLRGATRLDELQGRLEWGVSSAVAIAERPTTPSTACSGCFTRTRKWRCRMNSLTWAAILALEMRRRVKEAQALSAQQSSARPTCRSASVAGPRSLFTATRPFGIACGWRVKLVMSLIPSNPQMAMIFRPQIQRTCRQTNRHATMPSETRSRQVRSPGRTWCRGLLEGLQGSRCCRRGGQGAQALQQRSRLRRGPSRDQRSSTSRPPQRRSGHLGRSHRPR